MHSKAITPVIIAGVQRAGTTSLATALGRIEPFFGPSSLSPEPKVFLREESLISDVHDFAKALAAPRKAGASLLVEKSVAYFELGDVARRIKISLPDARIIVVLRNPLLRALSHYQYSKLSGLEWLSFADAIVSDIKGSSRKAAIRTSMNPFAYVSRSIYGENLSEWMAIFGRNLHVVFLENLVSNLQAELVDSGIQGLIDSHGESPTVLALPKRNSAGFHPSFPDRDGSLAFLRSTAGPIFQHDLKRLRRLLPNRLWDWDSTSAGTLDTA